MSGNLIRQYANYIKSQPVQTSPVIENIEYGQEFCIWRRDNLTDMRTCPKVAKLGSSVYKHKDGRIVEIGTKVGGGMLSQPIAIWFESYTHWSEYSEPMSFNQYHERW